MNVVLFGGSFNPPHLGHVLVIEQAFELIPNVDELWLVPTHHHTFGKHNNYAPDHHRLAMTKFLLQDHVKLCPIEIDLQLSGQTIDTVHALKSNLYDPFAAHRRSANRIKSTAFARAERENVNYSFLMGSDNLKSFTKWGNWQDLLEEIPFYIYPRAGFPMKPLYQNMTPLEHPLQIVTNISSTLARHRLQAGLNVTNFIPTKVLKYIRTHHLYAPE